MKKGGIKGGVQGMGKGIYGLIVKPVAGLFFIFFIEFQTKI